MKLTEEGALNAKTVVVYEKGGDSASELGRIFRLCGRGCFRVLEYNAPLPRDTGKPVLLLCGDAGELNPDDWSVCVAEREISFRAGKDLKLITYSLGRDDADFTARNMRKTPDGGTAFEIVGFGVIGRVRLKGGLSDVEPLLAAACAAVGAGIPFAEVLKALNSPDLRELSPDETTYKPKGQFTE